MRLGLRALVLVTLLAWAPLALLLLGTAMADLAGCPVNEGSVQPCLVRGVDIGSLLYTLFMMGWLMVAVLPIMLATAVIWLVLGARWLWRRFR